MTEGEKYLFDLNGYWVIRDVLSPEEVAALPPAPGPARSIGG